MSIDKQRITGVKVLEALGYKFANEWKAPAGAPVSLDCVSLGSSLGLRVSHRRIPLPAGGTGSTWSGVSAQPRPEPDMRKPARAGTI